MAFLEYVPVEKRSIYMGKSFRKYRLLVVRREPWEGKTLLTLGNTGGQQLSAYRLMRLQEISD